MNDKLPIEDYHAWAKENPDTDIHLGHSGFDCKAANTDYYHFREEITLKSGESLSDIIRKSKEVAE